MKIVRSVVRDARELGFAAIYMTGALVWMLIALFFIVRALQAAGVIE